MPGYYPPPSFHFKVEVLGMTTAADDVRFTDVSGLAVELVTEEVAEGGENRFVQRYPLRARYPELVLRRGLLVGSAVVGWVEACLALRIEPRSVDVKLLNDQHQPLLTWHLVRAYPTRWSVGDLSATQNGYAVESMQLQYQYFTLDRG